MAIMTRYGIVSDPDPTNPNQHAWELWGEC